MANKNLSAAKNAKNDEFYTQYADIQKEVSAYLEYNPDVFRGKTVLCPCDDPEWSNFTKFFAQNFDTFGLKKLISTSYAYDSKNPKPDFDWQPTLFEAENPNYDAAKSPKNGKIFTLTDQEEPPRDLDKLKWNYLEGDGDFRSDEVKKLRDEADIIVTNPPFSLFREFIPWLTEADKKFVIIGNKNAVIYREVFPLIKENKMWSGKTEWAGGLWFETTSKVDVDKVVNGVNMKNVPSIWFTNIDHGRRHDPLILKTVDRNIKYSKHKEILGIGYHHYDNFDAIDVPYTDAIPSDYDGIMGVPISFLDKYCPEQFEIITLTKTPIGNDFRTKIYGKQIQHNPNGTVQEVTKANDGAVLKIEEPLTDKPYYEVDGLLYKATYPRLLIKHKNLQK